MLFSFAFLILLCVSVAFLARRFAVFWATGDSVRMVGEIYIPAILLVTYGFFAIPLFIWEPNEYFSYVGINFGPQQLFLALLLGMLGAYSFYFMVSVVLRSIPKHQIVSGEGGFPANKAISFGGIALAIFDVFIRMQRVTAGQYFDWMRGRGAEIYGNVGGALWLLQDGVAPILAAISAHRAAKNPLWMAYLVFLIAALVLEGKRTKLLLSILAVLIVMVMIHKVRVKPMKALIFGLIGSVFLLFTTSVILESRIMYRNNISGALSNPTKFIGDMVFEATPRAVQSMFGSREAEGLSGTGLAERTAAWPITFASAVEARQEIGPLPSEYFWSELEIVVPSIFRDPLSEGIGISTVVADYYGLGSPTIFRQSADLASTAFMNPYLYYGIPGIIGFGLLIGLGTGVCFRFATARFGPEGSLLIIGSLYSLKPFSNSLNGPIVGLRNFLIILLLFVLLDFVLRLRSRVKGGSVQAIQR